MAVTYDKDGAYIEIVENGVIHRRSIKWEDCVVSVPAVGTEKIDMVYINGSDQLVLVLEDESEITLAGASDVVLKSLFDANSILIATTDDIPTALTLAASRIPARLASGGIVAATSAQILAILTGQALAAFDWNSQNLTGVGDISIGANKLKTTSGLIKEMGVAGLGIRNLADNAYWSLYCLYLYPQASISFGENGRYIAPPNTDVNYLALSARETGYGYREVGRLQGAANPYFSMGGSQQFKFYYDGTALFGGIVTLAAAIAGGGQNITNLGNVTVANLITAGNVDGRDVSVDGTKLDGVESSATADLTGAEIVTLLEALAAGSRLDHGAGLKGLTGNDHTQYILHSLAAAANDFLVASGANTYVKKTLAEALTILGKAAASGLASLDASTKVVEQPASITDHILDEDDMASDSAAKVPTQQSVKAYAGSVSQANKTIYVDKEASGAADGTSWADAFTTIQAAVDSMEDVIIHAYTISVRDGTKKTGTADENTANHLVDDGNSQFVSGDVGKRVFNVTDGTWGVVTAYNDAGDLTLAADTFPDGDEDYVLEATPYRETVYLNSNTASYPAHSVLGTVTIQGEFYFNAVTCDANAVAGAIVDVTYDFSDVEIGDRVWVLDRNGANGRANDYEYGTVDDVTNAATGTLGTTLTKTPTTNWSYGIVKTEISGSDDGTDGGTARNRIFQGAGISGVRIYGFYMTFSNTQAVYFSNGGAGLFVRYCALEDCDNGLRAQNHINASFQYCYIDVGDYAIWVEYECVVAADYNVIYTNSGTERGLYVTRHSYCKPQRIYLDTAAGGADGEALYVGFNSAVEFTYSNISNGFLNGVYARSNSVVSRYRLTNNATNPVDPVGTSEGAYIS